MSCRLQTRDRTSNDDVLLETSFYRTFEDHVYRNKISMYRVPTETGVDLYPHENGVVGGTDVWSGNDEGGPRGRLRPHPINRRDVTTKVEPTFERLGSRNRVHCVSGVRTLSVRLLTGSNRGTSGLRSTHSVLTSTLVLPSSRSEESFHHRSNHKRIS